MSGDGAIVYTGNIPDSLTSIFEKNAAGNIVIKEDVTEAAVVEAVQAWATAQTEGEVASEEGDGTALSFTGLEYGYYAITTTQGAVVTVTSTNPTASVYDKNSGTPTLDKEAYNDNVSIGQTVTYSITFTGYNYEGAGEEAEQIVSYTITDTLPNFLADVSVTSITINSVEYKVDDATPQFDANGQIVIPWVGENGASIYDNGATIIITYTATVTEDAVIAGEGNTNSVTLTWTTDEDTTKEITDSDSIYTYAFAIQKVNEDGEPLSGATFSLPFYVKATPDDDGAYIYAGLNVGEGLVNTVTSPENGLIVVKGISAGTYEINEITAPAGYNKVTGAITVTTEKTTETTTNTNFYLDENGNIVDQSTDETTTVLVQIDELAASAIVVVNNSGSQLPETGGIGTTLFYIFGGILVVGAVVLLVTKKRMRAA